MLRVIIRYPITGLTFVYPIPIKLVEQPCDGHQLASS